MPVKKRKTQSKSFITTVCPLCHSNAHDFVLYDQNFKASDLSADVFSARRLPDKLHYRIVKCGNDTMVRSDPILPVKELQKFYTRSSFTYQPEVKNLVATYSEIIEPSLKKLKKSDAILEIGCGNGFMLEHLHKNGYTQVFGVEPSVDAVKKAPLSVRRKIKRAPFAKSLFKQKKFSLIIIFQTLDHIPQPDKFLKDSVSLLKKGGYLLSIHHDIESLSAISLGEKSPIIDVEHTQLFSKKTSMLLFKNARFTVESIKSPVSVVSLKHLLWLFPMPQAWKKSLLAKRGLMSALSQTTVSLRLGNIAIVGRK